MEGSKLQLNLTRGRKTNANGKLVKDLNFLIKFSYKAIILIRKSVFWICLKIKKINNEILKKIFFL